jgi:hypothetical protein
MKKKETRPEFFDIPSTSSMAAESKNTACFLSHSGTSAVYVSLARQTTHYEDEPYCAL